MSKAMEIFLKLALVASAMLLGFWYARYVRIYYEQNPVQPVQTEQK